MARLLTITFTTAAFGRSSSWLFEASSYKATSEGLPPSFVQHDEFSFVFLTQPPHSPVLAQLAHTVLTLDAWRRSARLDRDVRRRQREYGPQAAPESVLRSNGSVGSAAEAGAATNAARLSGTPSFAARCPVRRGIGNTPSPQTGSTSGYPRWARACAVAAAPRFPSAWLPCACRWSLAGPRSNPPGGSSHKCG